MKLLNEETRRKLRELNLSEMVEVIDEQQKFSDYTTMSFDARMNLIIDYVYQKKYNTKVQRLIRSAKFRVSNASLNDVYYAGRGLDKETLLNLSTLGFMDNYTNVIFEGCTGGGKSYLACVLGMQACMKGIRTRYIRVPDLLMQKEEMSLDIHGRSKLLKKFTNYGLLILDEWLFDELNEEDLHFLFELIERRYNNGSTVFCTQYKQAEWYNRLGGKILGESLYDRLVHNAVWFNVGNMNMRKHFADHLPK